MQVNWDRLTALCWMLAAAAVLAQADHTDVELTSPGGEWQHKVC